MLKRLGRQLAQLILDATGNDKCSIVSTVTVHHTVNYDGYGAPFAHHYGSRRFIVDKIRAL